MLTRIEVSDMSPENVLSVIKASIEKGSPDDDLQFITHCNDYTFTGTSKHETLLDFVKQICEEWGRVRRFELTVVMEYDDE